MTLAEDPSLTLEQIRKLRDRPYHRAPELRVRTESQALAFVNEIGFCFLFSAKNVPMPTLWEATCGARRAMPRDHNDPDIGRVWRWKDTLPSERKIYYGKLLRRKPTLVSLELLPHFYALSPNYGDVEDYFLQYQEGKLSREAKQVYEGLMEEGALSTTRLRQVAGLAGGGSNARRFERAITELQGELKIVKVGISDANRWNYAYVYDLFLRRFPQVAEKARRIPTDDAMQRLLLTYLDNVVAAREDEAKRVFRWNDWEWERLLERLAAEGEIVRGLRIEGLSGPCMMTAGAARRVAG